MLHLKHEANLKDDAHSKEESRAWDLGTKP